MLQQVHGQLTSNVRHKLSPGFHQNVNDQADLILQHGKKDANANKPSMSNKGHDGMVAPWARGLFRHDSTEIECFTARYHAYVGSGKCTNRLNCFSRTKTPPLFLRSDKVAYLGFISTPRLAPKGKITVASKGIYRSTCRLDSQLVTVYHHY